MTNRRTSHARTPLPCPRQYSHDAIRPGQTLQALHFVFDPLPDRFAVGFAARLALRSQIDIDDWRVSTIQRNSADF